MTLASFGIVSDAWLNGPKQGWTSDEKGTRATKCIRSENRECLQFMSLMAVIASWLYLRNSFLTLIRYLSKHRHETVKAGQDLPEE